MKKLLVLIILILISSLLFLLLHDKGNEYLKPYLATYLESQLENNMSVTVEHLKIDKNHVELIALINKITRVNAHGQYALLDKTLDIDYNVKANSIQSNEVTINGKVDIDGKVKGTFSDMDISGEGDAFNSNIHYTLNLKEELFNNIKIKILKADIAEFLLLSGQPHYARGKIDIDINIPTLEENTTKGTANILLHETLLNEKVLNKTFQIDIPKNTKLTGEINSKINQTQILFNSKIISSLSTVTLNNAIYNLKNNRFTSNYTVNVPKLSKLSFLTQQKLHGTLDATGDMEFKNKTFYLNALTKSLGGTTRVSLKGNTLDLHLDHNKLEKILHLVGEKTYAVGNLNGEVKISSLKNLTGTFNLSTQNARTLHKTLKKELTLDLGKSIAFQMNSIGKIKSKVAHIQTTLDSELFKLSSHDMAYDLKKSLLTSTYQLSVPKLSKLNTLAGKNLRGALDIKGDMQADKNFLITGNTQNLGGEISFQLQNKQLTTKIKNVSVQKLMHMLDYPQIFKATLVGDFNYNLVSSKGIFNSKLNQAQLLPNNLTKLIKQIRGVDLSKERYNETTFVAKLNKENINIDFNAKSKKVTMSINNGHINKANNYIDANYKVKIENKDIAGKIKGNISQPHITVDSSQFIKDTVIDAIQDQLGNDKIDDKLNDLGLGKKETETIKNILGDLFK